MEDSRPRPVVLESEKPKTVSGIVADWIPAESEYQRAMLSELCAIRQLLERAEDRAQAHERVTNPRPPVRTRWLHEDPAVAGQRDMMTSERHHAPE